MRTRKSSIDRSIDQSHCVPKDTANGKIAYCKDTANGKRIPPLKIGSYKLLRSGTCAAKGSSVSVRTFPKTTTMTTTTQVRTVTRPVSVVQPRFPQRQPSQHVELAAHRVLRKDRPREGDVPLHCKALPWRKRGKSATFREGRCEGIGIETRRASSTGTHGSAQLLA